MEDTLSCFPTCVDDEPVAAFQTYLLGDAASSEEEVSQEGLILLLRFVQAIQMAVRYDEDMDGGLGIDVHKGRTLFIPVHDVRGYLTCNDATKEAILHRSPLVRFSRNSQLVRVRRICWRSASVAAAMS